MTFTSVLDLDKAIEVVGKARTDVLTHTLISFLSGETDGDPKPKIYVFRLYLALGKFPQAAQMANGIARQELDQGRLRAAHEILFETYGNPAASCCKLALYVFHCTLGAPAASSADSLD